MARRSKNSVTVSLFPFMSILACVIGTLTLLITGMALGQMDNEVVHSAERYDKVKRQIEKEKRRIQELEEKLKEAESGANDELKKLADAKMRLEELERQREALFAAAEKPEKETEIEVPIVDEDKHKKRIAAIQEELQELNAQIAALQSKVAELGDVEESKVIIQPSGSGVDLNPTFVECRISELVFLEEDPPRRVRRADMGADEGFRELLAKISKDPKGIVIFLVREDALGTYFAAYDIARQRYARAGKLPVIGQGQIDLSVFKQLQKKK